jgi:ATP-dependent Clp protease ATP-binding subunit ClpC
VYFIRHEDGRLTGILIRDWHSPSELAPAAAYGESEEAVLRRLELLLRERDLLGSDPLAHYLWEEPFAVRRVSFAVHPQSTVKKQSVIGRRQIPLRLSYAWSRLGDDAYRVLLPRFGWGLVLEDLEMAGEVLTNLVSAALAGSDAHWIYDFRHAADEYVQEWLPALVARRHVEPEPRPAEPSVLDAVAEEMVEATARRTMPHLVGKRELLPRERALLGREPLPSLLVVGPPGAGKTTWVRVLAEELLRRRRDKSRRGPVPRIWRTSGERIIAGMIYLGQWQQRCLDLVEALRHDGDYLYVEQLTSILTRQSDGASIADLLLPAVVAEEISLIAECTEAELARCRQSSPALAAQFQIVRIEPIGAEEAARRFGAYLTQRAPHLTLDPTAQRRLVQYLDRFERASAFPGKAFRFADWLVRQSPADRRRTLHIGEASEAYAHYSGLPVSVLADEVPATSVSLAGLLAQRVIGQEDACSGCARVLTRLKAGLNDPERPVGSLLFVGPTGVGKTELAKQLARTLYGGEGRLVRVDMSEYLAAGSSRRLLQVGDGVQSLAEQVRRQPLCVVLLDEIEKAHPEVFDLLLGILGEGRLTDSVGRLVDFRMALVVMTSNLGVSESAPLGYGERPVEVDMARVRRHFRPEFFGRLDQVVAFRRLGPADMLRILDLELARATARAGLERRRLQVRVEPEARALLAERGYDPSRGARPLQRVLEELVMAPLALRLSADPGLRDREIAVVVEEGPAWSLLSAIERDAALVLHPRHK